MLVHEKVNQLKEKANTVCPCELCGFGYRNLDDEHSEQCCTTHDSRSPEIVKKAIYKPGQKITRVS